jgi:hypothetical protein
MGYLCCMYIENQKHQNSQVQADFSVPCAEFCTSAAYDYENAQYFREAEYYPSKCNVF